MKKLAENLIQKHQYDEALQCCNAIIKVNPHQIDIYKDKCELLKPQTKYEELIETYFKAGRIDFFLKYQWCEYLQELALGLTTQKKYDLAIKCYDKMISLNPDENIFYLKKVQILEIQDNYLDVITCCNEALFITQDVQFFLYKAKALVVASRWERAFECYDEGIRNHPQNSQLFFNKAKLLICEENFKDAFKCIEEAMYFEIFSNMQNPKTNTPLNQDELLNIKGEILETFYLYKEAQICYKQIKLSHSQTKMQTKKNWITSRI